MRMMIGALGAFALAATIVAEPSSAAAEVVVFSGFDPAATGPGNKPNADAAHAAFASALAVRGGEVFTVDFEGGPAGPLGAYDLAGRGVLTSNDPMRTPAVIKTSPTCNFPICGGNTTPGGRNYVYMTNGIVTFTFDTGIEAFGGYFSGGQFPTLRLTFDDGEAQSIAVPGKLGADFVGFTDFGRKITSVSFNADQDLMSFDDITFATAPSGTPEPSAWALMIGGFGLAGSALRGRRRTATTA